jgi:heme exporter protein B
MAVPSTIRSFWWLIHKDLRRELRAHYVWPSMLLLGVVLVGLLAIQIDLPLELKGRIGGGLLWMAIAFSGTLAFDRSFAGERDGGCWQVLVLYPAAPSVLFLAKMAVNLVALIVLELALVPLFVVMTDVPLLARPGPIALIGALGSIGFAAIGTLVSVITADLRHRGSLVALLLLPLVMPVVLACAETTSLVLAEEFDWRWWRWIQLLGIFAAVFTALGVLAFEVVTEE